MKNLEILIKQTNKSLEEKLSQLEVLESEKSLILNEYQKSKASTKVLLEMEMKKSEEKYKALCIEIKKLAKEVKKLKAEYI